MHRVSTPNRVVPNLKIRGIRRDQYSLKVNCKLIIGHHFIHSA
jgi:hypothetical protein